MTRTHRRSILAGAMLATMALTVNSLGVVAQDESAAPSESAAAASGAPAAAANGVPAVPTFFADQKSARSPSTR